MTPTEARLAVLAAAVRALCRALPPEVAHVAATGLQLELAALNPGGADADAAAAGELRAVLGALARQ